MELQNTDDKLNQWRLLLAEKSERNISIKSFCKEKGISLSQFYYYQKIFYPSNNSRREKAATLSKNIKPIHITQQNEESPSSIRFILPNGLQCVLPHDMSLTNIKGILEIAMSC